MSIRKKGCQGIKQNNLPVIFCSNFHPDHCYKNIISLNAFKERLDIVEVHQFLDLDNVQWEEPIMDDVTPSVPPIINLCVSSDEEF